MIHIKIKNDFEIIETVEIAEFNYLILYMIYCFTYYKITVLIV